MSTRTTAVVGGGKQSTYINGLFQDSELQIRYYLLSACIYILVSYSAFWINRNSVSARIFLTVTTITIPINFIGSISQVLPQQRNDTWADGFIFGVFIFTCVSVLEVTVVSFCSTQYNLKQKEMENIIISLKDNMQKVKQKFIILQKEKEKYTSPLIDVLKTMINTNKAALKFTSKLRQKGIKPFGLDLKTIGEQQNEEPMPVRAVERDIDEINSPKNEMPKVDDFFRQHIFRIETISDNVDDCFSVEEEKTNGSRNGSFFEVKKNKQIVLHSSTIQENGGRFMQGNLWEDEEVDDHSSRCLSISELSHSRNDDYKIDDLEDSILDGTMIFKDSNVSNIVEKQKKYEKINKEEKKMLSYTKNLTKHVDNLEEATKNKNPAKFQMAFNDFKIFVVENWTQIDYDIDSKTRKQIETVFEIENSTSFKTFKWLSETIDYFFRFAYPLAYCYFLAESLHEQFNIVWLHAVAIIVLVFLIFLWCLFHVHWRKKSDNLTWWGGLKYYLIFYCIHPEEKSLRFNKKKET